MHYTQYRRMRKLGHECCNDHNGKSIILDNGEECVCVQSISYSLLCKWFRCAVLPLDKPLETALLFREELKRCVVCGQSFLPGSNRAKYCRECAARMKRKHATERKRKQRLMSRFRSGKNLVNQALSERVGGEAILFITDIPKAPLKCVQEPK